MGSGGGVGEFMGPGGCMCGHECVWFSSGSYCEVNSGVVADSGVKIGGVGPWIFLVCSLSMLGGAVEMVFPDD